MGLDEGDRLASIVQKAADCFIKAHDIEELSRRIELLQRVAEERAAAPSAAPGNPPLPWETTPQPSEPDAAEPSEP
jgi:DNA-binding response OmpR family regulator